MDGTENAPFASGLPVPSAARPLLGLTVLVVEDSRYACETLRLLCLRSGARIRRADSLRAARRHLRVYRPSIAIVDLGLPDGDGTGLIEDINRSTPRPEVILGLSGDTLGEDLAVAAGADGFLAKPITNLAAFQEMILNHLPAERRPAGPRLVPKEKMQPDPIAYRDDMVHAAELLRTRADEYALDYIAQFLGGVARSARDNTLEEAAMALAQKRAQGMAADSELARMTNLINERLNVQMAI